MMRRSMLSSVLSLMGSELTPSAVLAIVLTLETARLWDEPRVHVELREE